MRLTGYELIAELQKLTPEQLSYEVQMEGCDCDGKASSVVFETHAELFTNLPKSYIYITREPE